MSGTPPGSGLVQGEAAFRRLLDSVEALVTVFDTDGRVTFASTTHRSVLGHDPDRLVGRDLFALIHPGDRERARRAWRPPVAADAIELRLRDGAGGWRLLEAIARDVTAEPQLAGIVVVARDVSGRRRAEMAFRESERRYDALARVSPVGIFHTDAVGYCLQVNERWLALSGLTHVESLGRGLITAVHPDDRERVHQAFVGALLAGDVFRAEYRLQRPDGSLSWVIGEATPQRNATGALIGFVGTVTDITERTLAEHALRDSERLLQTIFDTTPECVKLLARDGTILKMNGAGQRMLAASSPADVVGQNVDAFVVAADRETLAGLLDRVFAGESGTVEFDMRALDGLVHRMESHVVPFRADDGTVSSALAITRDITRRREFEEQARQRQRLEALGRLAAGIAHDFNNLLTVVSGRVDMLLQRHLGDPLNTRNAGLIRDATTRAAELVGRVLSFSRAPAVLTEVLDLNGIVESMRPLLERLLGEQVALEVALAGQPLYVHGDRTQLEQVVMNLAANARDAVGRGGEVRIVTAAADDFPAGARRARQPTAVLVVSDTGRGMSADVSDRVFDPFFTTKPPGEGTGLGLATVYAIVARHDGHIAVVSAPGAGATFTIHMPLTRSRLAPAGAPLALPQQLTGRERVVVVEDEPDVRNVTAELLENAGYSVHALASSDLEQPDAVWRSVDLLLTDVVMPRLSGPQVATIVRASHPEARVLYMSGYPYDVLARHGIDPATVDLLPKPFSAAALLTKVREILDRQ